MYTYNEKGLCALRHFILGVYKVLTNKHKSTQFVHI